MNYIKRLENTSKTAHTDYLQIFNFIDSLEIETNKILQEELLIKQLSESVKSSEENITNNTQASVSNLTEEKESFEEQTDQDTDVSKPKSASKIVFETSNSFLEIDISMSDIVKGGTIISEKDKK